MVIKNIQLQFASLGQRKKISSGLKEPTAGIDQFWNRQFEVHQKCNNQNRYQFSHEWTSQKINPKIRPCNTQRNWEK